MKRRTFLLGAGATAAWIGSTVILSSCYNSNAPDAPTTSPGDVAGQVSANHGHSVVITAAQVTAGNAVNLTLTTANGHTHSLSLTSSEVTNVGAGSRVSKMTGTGGGHAHTVTFN